jgi:hypothetical protein
MSWLIESYLSENDDTNKKIDELNHAIKNEDEYAEYQRAKINQDAAKRMEKNPENADKIEVIRKLKIKAVNNGNDFIKKKHREAIRELKKNKEED